MPGWSGPPGLSFRDLRPSSHDPHIGRMLRALADAELGLWLTHQFGIDVALIYGDDRFTVRLRAGTITS
jgi:hypothetical protein